MQLGPCATNRHYFERDQSFPDALAEIVNAYEKAAETASVSARRAIATGVDADYASAQWDEAVAQTLCLVLASFLPDPLGLTLPTKPRFRNQ